MLEDFRLKVFMAVVAERSFTKAAKVLGITQPSVSQNIADLEKMTGRKLFDRLRGSVELTAEGGVFKVYVDKLQEIYSQMDDMFAKLPPATVRLSASEELYTYLIGPALEAFVRVHPDIVIERCLFDDADLVIALHQGLVVQIAAGDHHGRYGGQAGSLQAAGHHFQISALAQFTGHGEGKGITVLGDGYRGIRSHLLGELDIPQTGGIGISAGSGEF